MSVRKNIKRFWHYLFLFTGCLCLGAGSYLLWLRYAPDRLAFHSPVPVVSHTDGTNILPLRISIPAAQISLPVIPTRLHGSDWPVSDHGVMYLQTTAAPGERGNAVFYGHNWPRLLGRLTQVRPGDQIYLRTKDGKQLVFRTEYTLTVTPDDTRILAQTHDSRITIYTCTGFLDSRRFVVVAIQIQPLSVSSGVMN